MYKQELETINAVYGVTRLRRMEDLIAVEEGWDTQGGKRLNPESLAMFMRFTERFGKVADDLAIFMTNEGNLEVNWSTWNTVAKTQCRGNLTKHCTLTFFANHIDVYRDAHVDNDDWTTTLESPELASVIEEYRTHRLRG